MIKPLKRAVVYKFFLREGGQVRANALTKKGTQFSAIIFGKKCTPCCEPRHYFLTVSIRMQGKYTNCGVV